MNNKLKNIVCKVDDSLSQDFYFLVEKKLYTFQNKVLLYLFLSRDISTQSSHVKSLFIKKSDKDGIQLPGLMGL